MKFAIQQDDLQKALDIIANVVPAKTTLPILTCVLMEAKGGRLTLSSAPLTVNVFYAKVREAEPDLDGHVRDEPGNDVEDDLDFGGAHLEVAFAGDPYNPWYKNTLDLLDTFDHYRLIPTEHFEIFIHETEADLLGPYAARTAEEAFAGLLERYGAAPPTPIRLEIYPNHRDAQRALERLRGGK